MTLTPTLEEVLRYGDGATHAALTLELIADTETPISLYAKLAQDRSNTFLLESVEGGETLGRYSFIGFEEAATLGFGAGGTADPLKAVAAALARYKVVPRPDIPPFQGGAVGYVGFEAVRHFESIRFPVRPGFERPESLFMLLEDLAIFDHLKHRLILLTHVSLEGDRRAAYHAAEKRLHALVERIERAAPQTRTLVPAARGELPAFEANMSPERYMAAVREAKEQIKAGEIFQVVLSQRLTVKESVPPLALYRALRSLNPSPYMFYLRFEGWAVVGASPEVLVRVEGDDVLVRPIAGTRPRGKDEAEDAAREEDLLHDEKELAEHRMLLDLGRNDVGRVAELGSVRVERPLHIERYSHVMHMVSDVHGKLRPGKSIYDVLRACFPAGTVSGAPKIRAMELIGALEPTRRGLYAGAVGYFDFAGNIDTCIAIRTMVVEPDRVHLQAGAGIVHDSVPEKEHAECMSKARSGLMAIALAKKSAGGAG